MKLTKFLLLPFAWIYGVLVFFRNRLYDLGIFKSTQFEIPTIGVGNITVGGTGKSPHIEYLIRLLQDRFTLATLSRGYGRTTRGYVLAGEDSDALEIGDEPAQFKSKFPNVAVAVAEHRVLGIPELLTDKPDTNVIFMDDVFQHRAIKPGLSILLTDYSRIFPEDYLFPVGRLREWRWAYKRADIIVVTKCPKELPPFERRAIVAKIKPKPYQEIFFSRHQ